MLLPERTVVVSLGLFFIHRAVPALVILLTLPALMFVSARPVEAHSTVIASRPAPGERLSSSPGVVTIVFSEPINASLSRGYVSAPDGQRFEGEASSPTAIDIQETTNAIGVYVVDWTTVSSVDGHVLHGSFEFGVGVSPGAPGEQNLASPQPSDLFIAAIRALEYLALFIAMGMIVLLELAGRVPPVEWVRTRLRTRLWIPLGVALAAGIAVVSGDAANAAGSLSAPALFAYLGNGLPGFARTTHLMAEAIALLFAVGFFGPRLVLPPLVIALGALAASGHAAASQPWLLAISVDSLHLLAAGVWVGGILGLATLQPPGGWRGDEGRKLLRRFSWVALPAFAISVLMGVVRATEELSNVSDLVSSTYGRVLDVKVLLIAAMLPLSLIAWRRRRPWPRAEASIAVAVIAATALLSSFPLPPARAAQADAATASSPPNAALPEPTDLTLAGRTLLTLVGLTIRPAMPGPNTLWLYLSPIPGGSARNVIVTATLQSRPLPLIVCGFDCRSAQAELSGGEALAIQVADGGPAVTADFRLPQLPAPDASALLAAANTRMHGLGSLRIDELLGPAEVPLKSQYQMQAPDRMRLKASNGFESVIVGISEFTRIPGAASWETTQIPPLRLPYFIWDSQVPLAAHIVGRTTVDGIASQVVAFFENSDSGPLWFEVWIGSDGLMHQTSMTAEGHYMDHHYYDFNLPLNIQAPATS
jgi:copper transport protein